jgi:hypothetical protein
MVNKGYEKYYLHYNNVCTHLIIDAFYHDISELTMVFNGIYNCGKKSYCPPEKDTIKFDLSKCQRIDDHYILPLTKSLEFSDLMKYGLNFTKIDDPKIEIKINDFEFGMDKITNFYAITQTQLKIKNGMYNIIFSN